jgi:carboxypeptidase Q
MRRLLFVLVTAIVAPAALVGAQERVDLELITRIRDEGFRRSQVMEIAEHLTDGIGARVTGSPALDEADQWTRDKLAAWGLQNAHLEAYDFGRGWSWSRCSLDLLGEHATSLYAIPQGWTPGTAGPVEGEVFRLEAEKSEDLEQYAGKLTGKFVLLSDILKVEPLEKAPFRRYSDEDLTTESAFEIPEMGEGRSKWIRDFRKRYEFRLALDAFLATEGAIGILEVGSRSHGILRVPRGGEPVDAEPKRIPAVTVMTEHYNRLVRLLKSGQPVRLRLDVGASFHENGGKAFNTIAEIPGSKKKGELVLVGGHLDSYQSGTGAVDNAAGVAVVLEAVRILRALGVQPQRTVRVCLWSGEEQGLLGSRAYVSQHFASRPAWPDSELTMPVGLRTRMKPLSFEPEHARVSVYFNLDNGSGKIRGIYCEENAALRPVFEAWLAPFEDLGVTTVTLNRTGGTDHQSFDRVGIPGFQFIQDPLSYMPEQHHTNLDTYDALQPDDLRQAAVVLASVLIHAANREGMLPRKPRPVDRPEEN